MMFKPCLLYTSRERITYDYKNRPLELSINSYKADEYKYIITLKKDEL